MARPAVRTIWTAVDRLQAVRDVVGEYADAAGGGDRQGRSAMLRQAVEDLVERSVAAEDHDALGARLVSLNPVRTNLEDLVMSHNEGSDS